MVHTAGLPLRSLLSALVLQGAALFHAATASAQTDAAAGYPKQPIKIVVGFAAGGGNDLIARILAQKMGERLGQPTVVENKPGAGAIIGAETVARSAPDGYTLLVAPPSTFCINPAVYGKLSYDPLKDFEYVSIVAWYPFLLSVNAEHPAKSVKELVAWGKANPAKANYASTSALFQLLTELFKMRTGAPFEHIPFKGSNEMMTAILSGQVTMAFVDSGPLMGHVKAGKARYIGASSMFTYQFAMMQEVARRHGWTRFVSMQNHYNLIYREEEREMLPLCIDAKIGLNQNIFKLIKIFWVKFHAAEKAADALLSAALGQFNFFEFLNWHYRRSWN